MPASLTYGVSFSATANVGESTQGSAYSTDPLAVFQHVALENSKHGVATPSWSSPCADLGKALLMCVPSDSRH